MYDDRNDDDINSPMGLGCSNGDQRGLGAYELLMQLRLVQRETQRPLPSQMLVLFLFI